MKNCPSCGAEAEDGARFCLECGHGFGEAPAAVDDPWRGRMVAGRFRLLQKLGEGGMGEVYRAEQLPMGRHVAVKVLRQSLADDPRQVERFKREAQAVSQLSHPNTIIVHDFGQDADGTLFLAMELLEGHPLAHLIEGGQMLPPARAVHIMSQVCGSLAEAHGRGMVHRDLKPENIFLSDRAHAPDVVKVLDFGIAKVTQGVRGDRLETLTHAGAIFGTPQYMAPEQIRGEEIDARADVYALGVVLYQMISGQLPFEASTVVEMLTKHLSAQPAPISRDHASAEDDEAYARLEAIALRALSKDPNQRQPSARAFLEDLMAAMPNLMLNPLTGMMPAAVLDSSHNLPRPVVDDAPAPARSRGGLYVVLAIAVAVAIGGLGWQFFVKGSGGGGLPPGTVGKASPAVVAQPGDEGGDPAGGEPAKAPESAPASAPESAPEATPPSAPPSAAESAAAAPPSAPESAAATPTPAGEQDGQVVDPGSDPEPEPERALTDEEAKRIAAEEEAKSAAAAAAAAAAGEVEKAKIAEEKAAQAAADKQAAAAAKDEAAALKSAAEADKAKAAEEKAAAEAAKAKAQEQEAAANAAKAQAEAQRLAAEEAAAAAKAQAATADADRKKAQDEAAAAKAAREAADAKAAAETKKKEAAEAKAAAEAKKKVEAEARTAAEKKKTLEAEAKAKKAQAETAALKAQLAQIEADKIAAANKAEEERIKKADADAKAKAAKDKKTANTSAFGKLIIASNTKGMMIKIAGKQRGRTPLSQPIQLKAGKHSIVATKDGRTKTFGVTVPAGKTVRAQINM